MDQEKELSPQQERELTRKLRSASSIAEIKEIGSQLGMDFTEELAKKYLETIMRNSKGSPRAKIVGMVPATDEERIHLMKTLLHFTEEKARGLLKKWIHIVQHTLNVLRGRISSLPRKGKKRKISYREYSIGLYRRRKSRSSSRRTERRRLHGEGFKARIRVG